MVEHLTGLSSVESKVESKGGNEGDGAHVEHQEGKFTVTVGIEGIVAQLVTIRLIMGIWLVHDQLSVGVWREDVLVTIIDN